MYTTRNGRTHNNLFPQIDTVLNEIFNTTFNHAADEKRNNYSQPSANVIEYKDRYEIQMAIPGFEKSDLSIKVDKYVLTIASDKENKTEDKFKLKEFNYGVFSRKFKLPQSLDLSTIEAALNNGLLTVGINKRAEEVENGPKEIIVE